MPGPGIYSDAYIQQLLTLRVSRSTLKPQSHPSMVFTMRNHAPKLRSDQIGRSPLGEFSDLQETLRRPSENPQEAPESFRNLSGSSQESPGSLRKLSGSSGISRKLQEALRRLQEALRKLQEALRELQRSSQEVPRKLEETSSIS